MEPRDIYYIVALLGMVIGGVITMVITFQNLKGKVALVSQALLNHKENHEKLEKRVANHEDKVDQKLEAILGKIDEVKDMVIELKS